MAQKDLPLSGIKIIDFTHVQAGPACTQLLAWFGADVIKVERPGAGDVTRSQLRDVPDADALYFTMLNSNKRSLTLDTKTQEGKEVLEKLIKQSDVMVENFGPGALDRVPRALCDVVGEPDIRRAPGFGPSGVNGQHRKAE